MFLSKILPGERIIDDDNFAREVPPSAEPDEGGYGYLPRDWDAHPYGSMFPTFESFGEDTIPRDAWDGMIEEGEKTESTLSAIYLRRGWPKPNQNGTNFCWMYAVTSAMKLDRAKQNLPWLALSAESAAAPINGFRNSGGWSTNGAKWAAEHGVCTEETWPIHRSGISRSYYTEENKQAALLNKITSWMELPSRKFEVLATSVLRRRPSPIGLNWWRHAICAADLVKTGARSYGIRILNSHNDGFIILSESKATPDDVCCLYDTTTNVGKV